MFCKNCGRQLADNPKYCPYCGQSNEAPAPAVTPTFNEQSYSYGSDSYGTENSYGSGSYGSYDPYGNPYGTPYGQATEEKKNDLAGSTLKWGILSLAFSTTFFLSLLGFIFSFVAKARAREYVRLFGEVEGRSRVGRDLGTAGFIVGLILTIFSALYFLLIFILVLETMLGGL